MVAPWGQCSNQSQGTAVLTPMPLHDNVLSILTWNETAVLTPIGSGDILLENQMLGRGQIRSYAVTSLRTLIAWGGIGPAWFRVFQGEFTMGSIVRRFVIGIGNAMQRQYFLPIGLFKIRVSRPHRLFSGGYHNHNRLRFAVERLNR